jgi:hypothetical protein
MAAAGSEALPLRPPPVRDAARFVEDFASFWRDPSAERTAELLAPEVRLVQPHAPVMNGLEEVQREFGKLFRWLPDLRLTVDRWSGSEEALFIEVRLRATIGGRLIEWPAVDRFFLRGGYAVERVTYFDPLPVFLRVLRHPTELWRLWRCGLAGSLLRVLWAAGRSRPPLP